MKKTYYEILGVKATATRPEIKSAYRKLIKKYHPDINQTGAKVFEEISRAYNVVYHPERRKDYDNKLIEKSKTASRPKFRFRELKNWLFSSNFLKSIMLFKKVAAKSDVEKALLKINSKELLQRVIYSNNIFVQTTAVNAIIAKRDKTVINDLLRILFSGVHEDVKISIIEGLSCYHSAKVFKTMEEIYDIERSIKVKRAIRGVMKGQSNIPIHQPA